jgi:predicted DNA-binding transcriptional regulator AlpA
VNLTVGWLIPVAVRHTVVAVPPTTVAPNAHDDLIPLDEVCALGRITPSGFRNLRQQGRVPQGWRIGRRLYFRRADVDTWLAGRIRPV